MEAAEPTKESMFLWADIEYLRTQTEEPIEGLIKEIWETYFCANCNLSLSQTTMQEIKERIEKKSTDKTIFDNASSEILNSTLLRPLDKSIALLATAALYSKRYRKVFTILPSELFMALVSQFGDNNWKCVGTSYGVATFKLKVPGYAGFYIKHQAVIKGSVQKIVSHVVATAKLKDVDSDVKEAKILEKVGPETSISYFRKSLMGKMTDFCYFISQRNLEDGSVVLLGCSIDHSLAPESESVVRGKLDIWGSIVRPIPGADACSFEEGTMFPHQGRKLLKLLMKSDWVKGKGSARFVKLKQIIEKSED